VSRILLYLPNLSAGAQPIRLFDRSDNQFVSHRVSVKDRLKGGANELLLTFESAFLKGRVVEKQHKKLNLWNGDSSRLHVRKAQYNYGWDWGPVLMTTGPWKPIRLEGYKTRITDVDARVDILESLDVNVNVTIQLSEQLSAPGKVTIYKPNGQIQDSKSATMFGGKGVVEFSFAKDAIELWYPVGYGKQPLYTLEVLIGNEVQDFLVRVNDSAEKLVGIQAVVVAAEKQRIAFRRARIVEDKLEEQEGLTFLFEINNIRIFCGGERSDRKSS
jgi:beta-mannosidase